MAKIERKIVIEMKVDTDTHTAESVLQVYENGECVTKELAPAKLLTISRSLATYAERTAAWAVDKMVAEGTLEL